MYHCVRMIEEEAERAATVTEMEREAVASVPETKRTLIEDGSEAIAMLIRRGFSPSMSALDLPFRLDHPQLSRIEVELHRYAFRIFLRGAIQHREGYLPIEVSRFLPPPTAVEIAERLVALELSTVLDDGRHRLKKIPDSFGSTLEWYVARSLRRELAVDARAAVKFHAPGVGGDLDVVLAAEGKLIAIELKSSPPKYLHDQEMRAFVERTRMLRPDVAIFAIDSALRMTDKVVPMLIAAVKHVSGKARVPVRIERDIWGISPHVYVVNAKPDLISNIVRAIAEGFRALSPPPL